MLNQTNVVTNKKLGDIFDVEFVSNFRFSAKQQKQIIIIEIININTMYINTVY